MMDKPNPKDLALIIGQKPLTLVPALLEASRAVKQAQQAISNQQKEVFEDRAHKKMMQVFSRIDIKQNELEIYEMASKEVIIEEEVMGNEGGRNIVKRKIVDSRNINFLVRKNGRDEL